MAKKDDVKKETVKPKIEIIRPEMPEKKVIKENDTGKKSISAKPVEVTNLYQLAAEMERTIQQLTVEYAEAEESGHKDVGGVMKPTDKQLFIKARVDAAEKRIKELMEEIKAGSK